MIECKKLKATIPESTCITRQKSIVKYGNKGNGKNWGNSGSSWLNTVICKDCKIGLKLYKNHLEEKERRVT